MLTRLVVAVLFVMLADRAAAPARAATPPLATGSAPRNLLAHGTENGLWCADVVPVEPPPAQRGGAATPGARTVIRYRAAGDPQWRVAAEIAAETVSLGSRGNELLVVLADGQWRLVSDGDVRCGSALPGGANVLALAGDGDDIWAIAAAPKGAVRGPAPAARVTTTASTAPSAAAGDDAGPTETSPATETTATTAPTTATALPPHDVGLFRLVRGAWSEADVLPAGLRRDRIAAVSLAVLEGRLTMAVATTGRAIHVFSRTADDRAWTAGVDAATLGLNGRMKLMELAGRPMLWVSDAPLPGTIYFGGDEHRWRESVKLQISPKLAGFDRTALAAALGRLRLLASDGRGRLAEQIYKLDGSLDGPATEAVTTPGSLDNRIAQAMQLVVMAVLMVWIVGAMRQRPNLQEAVRRVDQLHLAPFGRRLLGGAIDAIPVIVAGLYSITAPATLSGSLTISSPDVIAGIAGLGIYLLHTTVLELIFARSVGKFITGTRVAALDGSRPRAGAVLTRNLLRIVDVVLLFPPVFVIFSPLRQRVGDMAGGTIVVRSTSADAARAADDAAAPPPTDPAT
jgi:uncharacterized RDD family membrane protein YckC